MLSVDSSAVKPPATDRGAQNTSPLKNRYSVDWLEYTIPSDDWQGVGSWLRYPDAPVKADSGLLGYPDLYMYGDAKVLHGRKNGGVHVILSGGAIRTGHFDPVQLISKVLQAGGHFTRIDLALDDFTGVLDPTALYMRTRKGLVTSWWRKFRFLVSGDVATGDVAGTCLYFGSQQSDAQVRIYDKREEQLEKGKSADDLPDFWGRVELQARRDRAQTIAETIDGGADTGVVLSGALRHYLQFREPGEDSNRSRWALWGPWERLLLACDRLKLSIKKTPRTIEQTLDWLDRQCSRALALCGHAFGPEVMTDIFRRGQRRLRPSDHQMLADFRRQGVAI